MPMTDTQRRRVARMAQALKDDLAKRGIRLRLSLCGWELRLDVTVPAAFTDEDRRATAAECHRRLGRIFRAGGRRAPTLAGPVQYATEGTDG